jgi:SAM-dependent methyltransferase
MASYYEQIAHAFDLAAGSYDEQYRANRIMAWMRAESLRMLRAVFPAGSTLLEIGCGTGDETLALNRAGYRIVAIDVSPAMIETARAKARAAGAEGLTWRVLPAGRLSDLAGEYEQGTFDGAYSSFGALNCEPRLEPVAQGLAELLRPGAMLAASVMNRCCAWEMVWGVMRLRPRQAFRRLARGRVRAGLESPVGRLIAPTYYYTPRTFTRGLSPHFRQCSVRGLPVFVPPPYLDHLSQRHPALIARLAAIDHLLGHRFPFRLLGDHFLAIMMRDERPRH